MNPKSWREMVDRTRELEYALGDGVKRIEANEKDSAIVQRRCLRMLTDLPAGHCLRATDIEALRPAPAGAIEPWRLEEIVGRCLTIAKTAGDALYPADLT